MIASMSKKHDFSGTVTTKMETDWSRLSLKTRVYQAPVFILKDGRKVSLRPRFMKEK